MAKLKIVTATGYSKEEASKLTGLNLDFKFDATTAYKNAGSPEGAELEGFVQEYVDKKIKGAAGIGFTITVAAGVADSRERPYKATNVVTRGARLWKTVYNGVVGANDKGIGGIVVFSKDTKGDAEEAAKAYVTEHKTDITVRLGKEVTNGQDVALTVKYTPSINATEGTYIFFGKEAEAA